MPNMKTCLVCNASLINKRPHALTCSGYCRTKLSRLNRAKPISVKLVLSRIQFNLLKEEADNLGLLINELVISRATRPLTNIGAQQ
jgi:hypothetical protein